MAFERNRQALPPIRQNFGLRLPNDRFCQVQPNFEYSDSTDVNGKKHNLATAMDEADTEIEMDDYRSAEIDDIFAQQQRIYLLLNARNVYATTFNDYTSKYQQNKMNRSIDHNDT